MISGGPYNYNRKIYLKILILWSWTAFNSMTVKCIWLIFIIFLCFDNHIPQSYSQFAKYQEKIVYVFSKITFLTPDTHFQNVMNNTREVLKAEYCKLILSLAFDWRVTKYKKNKNLSLCDFSWGEMNIYLPRKGYSIV